MKSMQRLLLVRLFGTLGAAGALLWGSPAQAHGLSGELLAGLGLTLLPDSGVELLSKRDHAVEPRLLLSWQLTMPLRMPQYGSSPVHHRLMLGPELLFADGLFRARIGYRFVYHPFFVGVGNSFGNELGIAGSLEIGYRFVSFARTTERHYKGPVLYSILRMDTPLLQELGNTFASSLVVGFGWY